MRHVDEGTIHAWLDGAIADPAERAWIEEHLRWCAACGARVADERATFEQAHALLAVAAPAAEPPAFEELAARAAHGAVPAAAFSALEMSRQRQRSWLLQAGWAASLVLAVGIGWMAREMSGEDSGPPLASVAEAPAMAPSSPAGRVEPQLPGTIVPEPAPVEPAPTRDLAQQSATARRGEQQVEAAPEATPAEAEGRLAAAAVPPPPTAPIVTMPRQADLPGATAAAAGQAFVAASEAARRLSTVESVTVTSAPAAPAAADASPWRPLPRTEAAARSGMALYGLDGLEPVLTSISADNRVVRTMYRLESGATVELEQERARPPGVANSFPATARAPVPRGRAAGIAADIAATPGMWSDIRGEVRVSLRTSSATQDLHALAARLRVE